MCLEERFRYKDTNGRGAPPVLCSGDACIALFPREIGEPTSPLHGHIAFRLDRDNIDRARDHLRRHGVETEYVEYARCHSTYFFDPDGYQIELSTYDV